MTKMLFKVSKLTFIHKQSIILDYSIEIRNLHEKDKIFLAGALGNYSLAGFEMVSSNVSWVMEFLTCEYKNPSIYNIIHWVAWTMGLTNRRPSV